MMKRTLASSAFLILLLTGCRFDVDRDDVDTDVNTSRSEYQRTETISEGSSDLPPGTQQTQTRTRKEIRTITEDK